jgi:hypothetical protein
MLPHYEISIYQQNIMIRRFTQFGDEGTCCFVAGLIIDQLADYFGQTNFDYNVTRTPYFGLETPIEVARRIADEIIAARESVCK